MFSFDDTDILDIDGIDIDIDDLDIPYVAIQDEIELTDLRGRESRTVAIMHTELDQRHKGYMLIIGADVFSRKIVKIVDSYGKDLGLCTASDDLKSLRPRDVIKFECELLKDDKSFNTLRIKSRAKLLGRTDFAKLKEKYSILYGDSRFAFDFIRASDFLKTMEANEGKEIFARLWVCSLIKHYTKGRYQIKLSYGQKFSFADILDKEYANERYNNKVFHGTVLVKGICKNGAIQTYIYKMHKKAIYDQEEYKVYAAKRKEEMKEFIAKQILWAMEESEMEQINYLNYLGESYEKESQLIDLSENTYALDSYDNLNTDMGYMEDEDYDE